MGKELDDLKAAVAAETSVTQAAVVLLADISARLQAALANDDKAALAQLATDLQGNVSTLAAAVASNTPAAAEPAPAPEQPPVGAP